MQGQIKPIDYLIIGHITKDRLPRGYNLGGTACYAALTAAALGLNVGIVTSVPKVSDLTLPRNIQIVNKGSNHYTEFRNSYSDGQRQQINFNIAQKIKSDDIPEHWRETPIVHLAPVVQEIDPLLLNEFPNTLLGVSLQGWLRKWSGTGKVSYSDLDFDKDLLQNASTLLLSAEDIEFDESRIDTFQELSKILVVTEGREGSRVYWNNDQRHIIAPEVEELDPTGVGDIYAASFLVNLHKTSDPWTAAKFATRIAANSVQRSGLDGIPTPEEIKDFTIEVL